MPRKLFWAMIGDGGSSNFMSAAKAFFTLAWGFEPEVMPIWGFSTRGAANSFIGQYNAGDWLVIVATQGKESSPEDRGRILGMLQVSSGSQIYDLNALVKQLGGTGEDRDYDENGVFKWPYGFIVTRAVRFDHPPLFSELFPNYARVGMHEAASAVPMPSDMFSVLKDFSVTEVALPQLPEIEKAQNFEQHKIERQNLQAWSKTESRSGSEHDLSAPHQVYLFFQPGCGVKVGMTNNIERRLEEINSYHRLDEKYFVLSTSETVKNAAEAEQLEMMMKAAFNKTGKAVGNECYRIPVEKRAKSIWQDVIVRWMQRSSG